MGAAVTGGFEAVTPVFHVKAASTVTLHGLAAIFVRRPQREAKSDI